MGISRRDLIKATASGVALSGIGLPFSTLRAESKTVKIGFLAPLTGAVSAWGLPGLYGAEIWAEKVNKGGGINIGGEHYLVEVVSFDNEYAPDKALQGYKRLVSEDDVKFIMMLGGDTWPAVQRFANRSKMLTSTLLPSDLSPDTPYLIAPSEVHPIYNVTGVQWLSEQFGDMKKVVIAAQNDSLGLPSVATYRAAFEAHGLEVVDQNLFDPGTTDFSSIASSLLSKEPDVVCLDTSYADYVNLLSKQLYQKNFKGKIISCTLDTYPKIIEKTDQAFMNGTIWQFPDFDDPMMQQDFINFPDPKGFHEVYENRHPGTWTAVSWEYASIMDLWKTAAENAGSIEPMDVLEEMKAGGTAPHAFGNAQWWGEELWGINNALVGNWPVVSLENGEARIQDFKSIPKWWGKHGDILLKHMKEMDLLRT